MIRAASSTGKPPTPVPNATSPSDRTPSSSAVARVDRVARSTTSADARPPGSSIVAAWITQRAASSPPVVSTASPTGTGARSRDSRSSAGPAARAIAPATPPPCSSCELAAFAIASTSSRVMSACSTVSSATSPPIGRRHPVEVRAHPALVDREDERQERLLLAGVLERPGVDRLVAGVAVELLDQLARLVVAAPEVARCRVGVGDPVVDAREVDVERLGRGAVRPRLHVLGVRGEAAGRIRTDQVGGVDHRLPVDALHPVERLGHRSARDCEQHRLGVGDVAALAADPRDVVTGLLPEIGESPADVALAHHRDLHPALLSTLSLPPTLAGGRRGLSGGRARVATCAPRCPSRRGRPPAR